MTEAAQAVLRPYEPRDWEAVKAICIATGLGGRLKEHCCDEDLFVNLWLKAYIKLDSSACEVAEIDGRIAAYLVGTFDDNFNLHASWILLPTVLTMIFKWATGQYRRHPATGRYIRWMLLRSWREHPRIPKPSCQFHFNIVDQHQDSMPGFRLARSFLAKARAKGKPRWHAVVFAGGTRRGADAFERMGFTIYDSKPCSLFGDDTRLATIVKDLGSESTSLIS